MSLILQLNGKRGSGSLALCGALAQEPAFDIASVKPSPSIVGHDGAITIHPETFTARNAPLKTLIYEAYRIPYSQIRGGPSWLNSSEYDIEAKAASRVPDDQLRLMLRTLLTERFKLAVHTETQERRVYVLKVGKSGARLHGAPESPHSERFHGDLTQFADQLAIDLTIPLVDDPSIPSRATGTPIPVLNKTGIEGVYDLAVDLKPESGADPFTTWQRALEDQLGLRLESQKAPVEIRVVDHAEKVPIGDMRQ